MKLVLLILSIVAVTMAAVSINANGESEEPYREDCTGDFEEWSDCEKDIDFDCSTYWELEYNMTSISMVCHPGCVCKDGYQRLDGNCIDEKECPKPESVIQWDQLMAEMDAMTAEAETESK